MLISETMPDEHPPTPPLCRWPVLITLPTLAKFQLVWRRLCDVLLFRSSCSFERTLLRPSVQYPSISLLVKLVCIQTLCDHLKALYIFDQTYVHRFEVRLELYGANARLIVNPPALSPSHLSTPPPCRWPALTTLPPLAKF